MGDIFGSDIVFNNDFELIPAGDIEITQGLSCLAQDIIHRLLTPRGNLFYNPDYGVDIYKYINDENTLINRMGLSQDVKKEVEKDPRVKPGSVNVDIKEWDLKIIKLLVSFTPIGQNNPLNLLLKYDQFESRGEVV
ncbi:MAG: hypothetical protein PWR10_1531 [Halanaerobiales bacterium]|nr:hypothetical protein [Halanaerobiales bacterium]